MQGASNEGRGIAVRNDTLRLAVVVAMLVNLVGTGLSPLPAAAAPATVRMGIGTAASLGMLPSWFTSVPALSKAEEPALSEVEGPATTIPSRVLPDWFATTNQPTNQLTNQPTHHTIHPDAVTVFGPDEINNCDVVTYTIVAANDTVTTTNVIITSTMPAGFTPTQRVFIVGTVNPTQTITRTAAFAATCSAVSGQNVVVLTQGITETEPITRYTNFVVNPGAITLRKEPSVVQASVGDVVTWTVKVENTGYGIVSNVIATDTLGTGLRYHSGFTSTSYISIPVGQTRSFTVAAEIVSCSGLDNDVKAAWGCSGETCQTRTAQANVDLVVRAPLLDYTPPNINVDYCAGQSTYTMTITNIGVGTAFTPSIAMNSNLFTVTSSSANYSGGAFHLPDDIPAGGDYVLTFTLSLPDPPCGMVGDSGVFLYRPTYYDECDNVFYPPVKSSNWAIGGNIPDLDVHKSGPSEVYANEIITYALNVTTRHISGTINITDTFRPHCAGYTPLNVAGGTVITDGSGNITITWATTDTNWTANVSFQPNTTCPTMCACCGVLASNYLTATVKDCQDCFVSDDYRHDNGRTTSIQCEEILNSHAKEVAPSSDESCTTRTYTSTYVFGSSFIHTPTWQGMVYTDLLPHQNYITGSAWISISNGTQACTATFTISDTDPLVIGNISPTCGITVPGATKRIVFQAVVDDVGHPCGGTSFYDWSYLNIGVTGNNASCPECDDGIFEEGVWVGVREPDMELTFSDTPPFVSSCGEYTFTMNLYRYYAPAYDVEAVFYTSTYRVMEIVGFTGPTPVLTTTDVTGYHWFYSDAFTTATTGQVTLRVQLACASSGNAPINGIVYYDNHCNDDSTSDHTCSDTDQEHPSPDVLTPHLILYKSPETIYASDDVVTWTLTAINSGAGAASG